MKINDCNKYEPAEVIERIQSCPFQQFPGTISLVKTLQQLSNGESESAKLLSTASGGHMLHRLPDNPEDAKDRSETRYWSHWQRLKNSLRGIH
jgi:hypothetical protein